MAHYGQMLGAYDIDKDEVYKAFNQYFENPTMTKIKDVDGFSVYMAKNYCLLSTECRYLVVFVEKDNQPLGATQMLSNLNWTSFQTRTLSDVHNLPPHNYKARHGGVLDAVIQRTEVVSGKASKYSCEKLPIVLTLLHKKTDSDYQDRGNIVAALETYQTIVTFAE